MLVGPYQNYQQAVMTFTAPACDHAQPMHVVSCTVTLYASQGSAVLKAQTAKLPVAEHMDDAAIVAMFQSQFNSLPEYSGMVAQ